MSARFYNLLLLASSAAAAATPNLYRPDNGCNIVDDLTRACGGLKSASAYCSTYYSVPAVTKTKYVNAYAAKQTQTVTSTLTGDAHHITETRTAQDTTTIVTTETVTPSTTYYQKETVTTDGATCYTAATTITAAPSAVRVKERRKANYPPPLSKWAPNAKSRACSCLSLKPSTVTTTVTRTPAAGTVTSTVYATTTPYDTMTTTVTSTSSTTSTAHVTADTITVTQTQTIYFPKPTLSGLNWYEYTNQYNYNPAEDPNADPSLFQNNGYYLSGMLEDVNAVVSPNWPSVTTWQLPGQYEQEDCSQSTVVMQGFFYAADAGEYTFHSDNLIDNQMWFWHGDIAYGNQAWSTANADYTAIRYGSGIVEGSVTITCAAGELVPVTMMLMNGGGPARARLDITTPDGTTHTDTTGFFIPACVDGNPFSP